MSERIDECEFECMNVCMYAVHLFVTHEDGRENGSLDLDGSNPFFFFFSGGVGGGDMLVHPPYLEWSWGLRRRVDGSGGLFLGVGGGGAFEG